MEQNTSKDHGVERCETCGRAMGNLATRLMAKLHRHPSLERRRTEGAVVYRGAGAPLLGDNPRFHTKDEADAIIDALLGKNIPTHDDTTEP